MTKYSIYPGVRYIHVLCHSGRGSFFGHIMATVQTRGATTRCTCNLNKVVPILDLAAGSCMVISAAIWM